MEYFKFREAIQDCSYEFDPEKRVARILEVENLGLAKQKPKFPVNGCISGRFGRSFINLICQHEKNDPINVIFLIVTGNINKLWVFFKIFLNFYLI